MSLYVFRENQRFSRAFLSIGRQARRTEIARPLNKRKDSEKKTV
ncbi:MAG: hypothetical protein ABH858_00755 [Candidatus Omnitrophota bacterium]